MTAFQRRFDPSFSRLQVSSKQRGLLIGGVRSEVGAERLGTHWAWSFIAPANPGRLCKPGAGLRHAKRTSSALVCLGDLWREIVACFERTRRREDNPPEHFWKVLEHTVVKETKACSVGRTVVQLERPMWSYMVHYSMYSIPLWMEM